MTKKKERACPFPTKKKKIPAYAGMTKKEDSCIRRNDKEKGTGRRPVPYKEKKDSCIRRNDKEKGTGRRPVPYKEKKDSPPKSGTKKPAYAGMTPFGGCARSPSAWMHEVQCLQDVVRHCAAG